MPRGKRVNVELGPRPRGTITDPKKLSEKLNSIISKKWTRQALSSCFIGSGNLPRIQCIFFDVTSENLKLLKKIREQVISRINDIIAPFGAKIRSSYIEENSIVTLIVPYGSKVKDIIEPADLPDHVLKKEHEIEEPLPTEDADT